MSSLFRRGKKASTQDVAASSQSERKSRDDKSKKKKKKKADNTTFRVKIPPHVSPNESFHVYAGDRLLKIKCPPNALPGQSIAISLPKEDKHMTNKRNDLHGPNVTPINDTYPPAYMVTIPDSVCGGQQFPVKINGIDLMVTCPVNGLPGMAVRIVPPNRPHPRNRHRHSARKGQLFEVEVPTNVMPGTTFALIADGIRISVKCPMDASPGQMVRFNLPFRTRNSEGEFSNCVVKTLNYDVDGWTRTLQISEMKFQWFHIEKDNLEPSSVVEKIDKLAYVTQLSDTDLEFIPAQHGRVDSSVWLPETGKIFTSCTDLVAIQTQSFSDKINSFKEICKKMSSARRGHSICIQVRREFLLEDSMQVIMCLDEAELQRTWRFEFVGEDGVDAGGLKREWFELISKTLFDPDVGLWKSCGENQMNLQINPNSALHSEDDFLMFRFLGRVLGKALFDQELISGHMVQYLYKHILGWPITFADLEHLDPVFYKSLHTLMEMDDVENACIDFTTTEENMGAVEVVDLIPDGENVDVTQENLVEYLEAVVEYRLVKRVKDQLKQLLKGFEEIVPKSLLIIFDFMELELLLCGLPNIDVDDWIENSRYSGIYSEGDEMHQVCIWFWELVREMSVDRRAKLLQFVTGTSGVPAKGFSTLQGNDGEIRLFQIHGVSLNSCLYPRAHTCFNRIDLPKYENKADLIEKLTFAISTTTGFGME